MALDAAVPAQADPYFTAEHDAFAISCAGSFKRR